MKRVLPLLAALLAVLCLPAAEPVPGTGSIAGVLVDAATGQPAEYATLTLRRLPDKQVVQRGATDRSGAFEFKALPWGTYDLVYAAIGGDPQTSPAIILGASQPRRDLGRLPLAGSAAVQMDQMRVSAQREAFYNSIDRKVYNVGKDIQSAAGSASGLLQNVPSVQVDVEGNVSLRGNDNVLILIDGKPSTLMSTANRADVLEQMPADSIDRIEVITNPSAKYKPDGTAGIINLVMKRQHRTGFSGVVRANVGNASRANAGVSLNYNPGAYNFFGTVSVRQDDRLRYSSETRRHVDAGSGALIDTTQGSIEHMRPLSRLVELGVDDNIGPNDKLRATASYNYLSFFRTSTVSNLAQDAGGPVTLDYDRRRTDPEWHKTLEVDARYQHTFDGPGHELDLEVKHDRHQELEDNHYENDYRTWTGSGTPVKFDYTLMNPTETANELTADYARPLAGDAKLEAGYSGEADIYDTDFRAGYLDPILATWQVDTTQTNRFIYKDWIDALYATYGRPIGRFGFLAGLRVERTLVHTNQATVHLTDHTEYYRLHPTLHLSYNLTDTQQLQLNYSHRVHRPESDDLNPFPEYQDPYNLRAGNPRLRPEETHSIEAGWQYRKDDTTYLAGVYYRDTYDAFTTVTRYIDPVTLLTTHENLASNQSGGVELIATTPIGPKVNVNLSTNAYYSQIDATNLGFSGNRSAIAWDAKLNAEWHATKTNLIQFNANYSARRLTAQGERLPTFYANIGWRHDFARKDLAFVVTISDLFNSLKERTIIDTPVLHDDLTRRRSSRIVYAGFIYTFGQSAKKPKSMDFDSSL